MLLSLLSDILQEEIVQRYPRAAPVVKTERKDKFVANFLHSSAQINVSITRPACASQISQPYSLHCDESVGQSASPASAVDIPWRSCSFRPSLSVADVKSCRLRLLFRRLFLRSFWPYMCPLCMFALSLFIFWNLCGEHQWSCVNHVPASLMTQVPLESIV